MTKTCYSQGMKSLGFGVGACVLALLACHEPTLTGPTPPSPTPIASPVATPTPGPVLPATTNGPLHIDDHRFLDRSGRKVYLLGGITCCNSAKSRGWPLVNPSVLDEIAANRGNYSHIRVGPNSLTSPDGDHVGYARAGDKLDLTQWDESFFPRVRGVVDSARARGIYIEVSLIDAWLFKHRHDAWVGSANLQGFEAGGCDQFGAAPHAHAERWVRKVVREIGMLDNVLWQDGNEVFDCGHDATAWVTGLHAIVRDEEARNGFGEHPFGTNSHQHDLAFVGRNTYEIVHDTEAPRAVGRPLLVNEYPALGPEDVCEQIAQGAHNESSFMVWRGNMSGSQWIQALHCVRETKERLGF